MNAFIEKWVNLSPGKPAPPAEPAPPALGLPIDAGSHNVIPAVDPPWLPDLAEEKPANVNGVDTPASSLKGQAVELWRDGRRFFLVTDEEDAQEAMRRFGAPRGEVWTSGELELVASIADQGAREIEAFKRRLNGHLSLDTAGKGTPRPERHGLKGKLR